MAFLKINVDVFSWDAYEASRVDLNPIFHHLNVNPIAIPRKQQCQRCSKEHVDVVKEEVNKLKNAKAIKEVFYLEWLVNTVVEKDRQVESLCGFHRS